MIEYCPIGAEEPQGNEFILNSAGTLYSMVLAYNMVCHGVIWHDIVWYDMVWYGVV